MLMISVLGFATSSCPPCTETLDLHPQSIWQQNLGILILTLWDKGNIVFSGHSVHFSHDAMYQDRKSVV